MFAKFSKLFLSFSLSFFLSSSAVLSAVARVLLLPCNVKYLGFGILGLLSKNDVANLEVWPPWASRAQRNFLKLDLVHVMLEMSADI